ncbi:MAG: FAD-linked oxidase C-terminal domain-containing protein [Acidobacteriota bacterium]|nr:FAD-linked oxidase C-terminal domain-containing protein [Acidobacteriota bacterium]
MSETLRQELAAAVDGEVRFDRVSRALYSTDASVYQIEPLGVVVPRSAEGVIQAVTIAARHGVPITPRGGGTSQAGQAIGAGLVLDTSKHLNRIVEINAGEKWARVQPGVVLDDLNAALRPFNLRFAPDVSSASRATVGGMMANNSSGARSVLYGKTLDHVREQQVVLSDGGLAHLRPLTAAQLAGARQGDSIEARAYRAVPELGRRHAAEIDRRFPKVLRRVGGYNLDEFVDPARAVDLTRILVGSEGTLGFIVEAKLGLVPLPASKAVLTIEFDELLDALGATPLILKHGPSAVEVMDDFILRHAQGHAVLDAQRRSMIDRDGSALLCVEFYGSPDGPANHLRQGYGGQEAGRHMDELTERMTAVERDLKGAGISCRCRQIVEPAAQQRIWSFREAALGLSTAMKSDGKAISFVEDTAVAPDQLRDYIDRFIRIVQRHDTVAGVYAHASVGCLHVRPVVNLKTARGVATFEAIANEVADLVLEFGGALSGEHGDGLVRGAFNERMFGSELYQAFREVKRTFDPDGLFNPGRIVDTPAITSHLRFGAGYETPEPATLFDYAEHGGYGRAVEMCSGVGLCRKTREGTMCPSYMVTKDEAHSTRGRANVLRLAMAGRLGEAGLADQGVHEVLDLCLECRACKSECPVGVDVAKFKSEFLSGYWDRHGLSAQAQVFGNARSAAEWGSRFAPLSNVVAASAPARWLAETVIGLDRRRQLPRFTRRTLRKRLAGRRPRLATPGAVLFADTFTEFEDPEIGVAALDVLDAAGLGGTLAPNVCCGRPLISQGRLREARKLAAANVHALYELAERGTAIVFVEPSCLSAVREDAPGLLRGELQRRARVVAAAAVLFEEYLERELSAGRATLDLERGPAKVQLHPHCHQRSMGLAAPARALLSRIPGAQVTDLEAGCCGMAGSFGYTQDHYEVSRAIGERKLLPAARALDDRATLVAGGTSCRHQVAHFAGVRAVHPAVLLRSLLVRLKPDATLGAGPAEAGRHKV